LFLVKTGIPKPPKNSILTKKQMIRRTISNFDFYQENSIIQKKNPLNYAFDKNSKQYLLYDWSSGCWDFIDQKTVILSIGTINVKQTTFEAYNQKYLNDTVYYLSDKDCLFTWNVKTNTWAFQDNYSKDLPLLYKLRDSFYLKSHLYSFKMPDAEFLLKIERNLAKLKNSVAKDLSGDLALTLHEHLFIMCPLLDRFLSERFGYYKNKNVQKNVVNCLINLLYLLHKKSINHYLNSTNVPQKIYAFVGPGQSGKSTFTNFIQALVGDGAIKTTSMAVVSNDSRFETFYWLGKSAILIPEVESLSDSLFWKRNLSFIKSVSGHDLVPWEVKFGNKGQSRVPALLILTSNHSLNPSTKSEYISQYRRMVNIFFAESIRKDNAKANYSEKLQEEAILFVIFCHFFQNFEKKA